MEEKAKGFAVVGARCPWVGVTGSALVGGLSWLSHEYGEFECGITARIAGLIHVV
jgi:hypothetical protein